MLEPLGDSAASCSPLAYARLPVYPRRRPALPERDAEPVYLGRTNHDARPAISVRCCGAGAAADGAAWAQTVELRYATSAPPKTVWEMQVQRFQKQVEDGSKGSLKINAFLNSQLGSEQDTVQQVARGRIDSGGYSVTAGSLLVPEISLLSIPFLFKDQKEQDCVYDNHLTKLTQDMFLKKGVVMLSWSEVGVADIIGKKPYISPDDLKGLKARSAPNKVAAFMWSQFGANPNPLPVTEWNSAFQTGLIDVAELGADLLLLLGPGQAGARRHHDAAPGSGRRRARQQGGLRQAVGRAQGRAHGDGDHHPGHRAARRGARLRRQDPRDAQGRRRHHRRAHPRAARGVAQGHGGRVAEDGRGGRRRGRNATGRRSKPASAPARRSCLPSPASCGERERHG